MIQKHIQEKEKLIQQVSSHPMCFLFTEYEKEYCVLFLEEVGSVCGVRCEKSNKNLSDLLRKLEEFWIRSNPVLFHDVLKSEEQLQKLIDERMLANCDPIGSA